ncbi:MAG: PIN domain-containing protein [Bacteroidales bacterium]|nr:PIN domain-containing protein [Bacteroidales bacterium]
METKVRYLVDTNIWLERLLDQEKSDIVYKFLDSTPKNQIFITDFTLHSIGVILTRLKKLDTLNKFVRDIFINGQIEQVTLDSDDFIDLTQNVKDYNLDFDDAYQLTVSQKYDMTIVTFDKDFNTKGIDKKSPEGIIGL